MTNYIKILLSILLWIPVGIFCQIDSTSKEFFPLHIGDIWQYRNENGKLAIQEVVGDTIINDKKYFLLIHSLKSAGGETRVDSLMRVQTRRGGPTAGDSCGGNNPYELSIYHLGESDSTIWEICENPAGFLGTPLIRFNNIFEASVFGQKREIMNFDFGGTLEGEDWTFGALLAKGIGVIEERYYEGGFYVLQGAIISGVQYGNIVSVDNSSETIPQELTLYQNYPNPFNPATTIKYEISKTTYIKLEIINILGQSIDILEDQIKYPGSYQVEFDASSLSSGIYIAVLRTPERISTRTMMLLK